MWLFFPVLETTLNESYPRQWQGQSWSWRKSISIITEQMFSVYLHSVQYYESFLQCVKVWKNEFLMSSEVMKLPSRLGYDLVSVVGQRWPRTPDNSQHCLAGTVLSRPVTDNCKIPAEREQRLVFCNQMVSGGKMTSTAGLEEELTFDILMATCTIRL